MKRIFLLLLLCLSIVGCEEKPSYEGKPEKGYKPVDRTTTTINYMALVAELAGDDNKEDEYVYDDITTTVYVVSSGKRYHYNPDCSNMKNPREIIFSEAISEGYTPCKNCVG